MLSTCIQWLSDWTQDLPPILDEYDLAEWLEQEGCESLELLLKSFKKPKVRQEAIEVLRALVWEWYLSRRDTAIATLPTFSASESADIVNRLLKAPQTAQKSAAWHLESRELLTGHEFAGVVYGTPSAFQAAVAKKCAVPLNPAELPAESRIVYKSPLSAFQWGWRFEQVIRTLYEEEVACAPVDDTLGRIRHPTLPRLAASPDGLITRGHKAGRLLEIKAPVSRVLTGIIPEDYYCQMQLQAEVCDVCAVEYVEVRFDTQPVHEFLRGVDLGNGELGNEDVHEVLTRFLTPTQSSVSPIKPERCGAVLIVADSQDAPPESWTYMYSPTYALNIEGLQQAICWKPNLKKVVLEHTIWRIADWWNTTVPRNKRWWNEVGQPAYESFWDTVATQKEKGFVKPNKCLIADSSTDGESDTETLP